MTRGPCCLKSGLKKGPWSAEEDEILIAHIKNHGHSNWRALPKQAGTFLLHIIVKFFNHDRSSDF